MAVAENRSLRRWPLWVRPAAKGRRIPRKQSALTDLQIENLRDVDRFEISHLRWQQFSDRMRGLLQVLVALLIVGVLAGAASLVWSAAHDHDLIVDAFTVPPDIAQTGLTGAALANRVLDRYGEIEDNSNGTLGAPVAFRHAADEVHLEIPETGVSLGEVNRTLRAWLGHDIHVSGELVRTAKGLALTVRYGNKPGKTFTGGADDLDKLAKKAGDHMFAAAQPYRYAEYLINSRRFDDAGKFIPPLARNGLSRDRARGYVAWGLFYLAQGDLAAAVGKLREAVRLDPHYPSAHGWLAIAQNFLGHEEGARDNAVAMLGTLSGADRKYLDPIHLRIAPPIFTMNRDFDEGDFSGEIAAARQLARLGYGRPAAMARAQAWDHDLLAARRGAATLPRLNQDGKPNLETARAHMRVAQFEQNWAAAMQWAEKVIAAAKLQPPERPLVSRLAWPLEAYAMRGRAISPAPKKLIARTPKDCDDCMRRRGQIAALAGKMDEAARDFAIVAARSPHIPFAETDWGEMLLHHGRYDAAIAQFKIAHRKGPHFADPLEMWGEALIAKNRSDLALAKFARSQQIRAQMGPAASEMGRGAAVVRRSCRRAEAIRHRRQALAARHPKKTNSRKFAMAENPDSISKPSEGGPRPDRPRSMWRWAPPVRARKHEIICAPKDSSPNCRSSLSVTRTASSFRICACGSSATTRASPAALRRSRRLSVLWPGSARWCGTRRTTAIWWSTPSPFRPISLKPA